MLIAMFETYANEIIKLIKEKGIKGGSSNKKESPISSHHAFKQSKNEIVGTGFVSSSFVCGSSDIFVAAPLQ